MKQLIEQNNFDKKISEEKNKQGKKRKEERNNSSEIKKLLIDWPNMNCGNWKLKRTNSAYNRKKRTRSVSRKQPSLLAKR